MKRTVVVPAALIAALFLSASAVAADFLPNFANKYHGNVGNRGSTTTLTIGKELRPGVREGVYTRNVFGVVCGPRIPVEVSAPTQEELSVKAMDPNAVFDCKGFTYLFEVSPDFRELSIKNDTPKGTMTAQTPVPAVGGTVSVPTK